MRRTILPVGMIAVLCLLMQAADGAEIRIFTPRAGATVLHKLQSDYERQIGGGPPYVANLKCITSPSATSYSLPSSRSFPASRAPASPPVAT
jgi:hypothetical protein